MNIHEYQAKEIFIKYGIPLNPMKVATNGEEALSAIKELEGTGKRFAVKAQVHAGGRGKGGGVKVLTDPQEIQTYTDQLIGTQLVTPQTGPEGKPVNSVIIESTVAIEKEYYAGIVLDRSACKPCLIVSAAGGMAIEEVAATHPDKILKKHFSVENGMTQEEADDISKILVEDESKRADFSKIFIALSKIFLDHDVSLIEINPLAIMENGDVIAIDAKINFDDHALFRHPDIEALYDPSQDDAREVEAKKFDLSYVGLDGEIGCVVNGAGLAMATMDIIKYAGAEPANFLDVGGGANQDKVAAAFRILLNDENVKAILINIFGGIMRCDVLAKGILQAVEEMDAEHRAKFDKIPMVVRLEGTNSKEGKEILDSSDLHLTSASDFKEAAEKVVAALKGLKG